MNETKPPTTSIYTSKRVYDGVRKLSPEEAQRARIRHKSHLKKVVASKKNKV